MAPEFNIGTTTVGTIHPPYVIAEAGVHHCNSVPLAEEYILSARVAGADAIKFQTYTASRLATHWAPTYWDSEAEKTQHEIFAERDKLTASDYETLFRFAKKVGITLLSTPFDEQAIRMLDVLGMPAFKIASADITNIPLLRTVAECEKPVLLSTGGSTIDEIRAAVDEVASHDVPISILHCSLAYPTDLADANLRRIKWLASEFPDLVVGYSDHTRPGDSTLACPLSVAYGARIVEKHYTLNKMLPGDDHYHAVDQAGLARLVKDCRDVFVMTPEPVEVHDAEKAARTFARRSVVAARPIRKGEKFDVTNLDCKRPGTGLRPAGLDHLLGSDAKRDYELDELIDPAELNEP